MNKNIAGESHRGDQQKTAVNAPSAPSRGKSVEASVIMRIVLSIAILALGLLGTVGLVMLKEDPAEAKIATPVLPVDVIEVFPEDVPVMVTGLGEARALNSVPIAPEVAGTVVEIHPRLEMGAIIPAGELLFRIDPRDYQSALVQATAQVEQLEKTIERLNTESRIDQERLETLTRNETLMQEEFERVKTLYEEDEVGTRSAVDQSEMARNQTADQRDLLAQNVALYPVRIQEAQSSLAGAKAQQVMAETNLARTEVRSEFDARIENVNLEAGQYVNPGMVVMTLADDRILELSVSLDSRDAKNWLPFETATADKALSWLGDLKPVACNVAWTEDPEHHQWEGTLHRIETFDQNTRTVTAAVRVTAEAARSSTTALPLVDGMFCTVSIPGKVMEDVYRVPRWTVTYEGNIYLVEDGRLVIRSVEIIRSSGEETFVRGLEPGATVITTRLANPLPNRQVTIRSDKVDVS